jgi:organic radical activating enzyme
MEAFYTIQGEGVFTGSPAFFIRLGGCPVGCVWCDVKESWDVNKHPLQSVDDLVKQAIESGAHMVVITGGEPAAFELGPLTGALKEAGLRTHIETSGAYPLSGEWDWVCLSPKKFKAPLSENFGLVNELKVIVYNKSDFAWGEQFAVEMPSTTRLLFQAEWSKREEMSPLIVDYVKAHPEWSISIQTHKYLGIP